MDKTAPELISESEQKCNACLVNEHQSIGDLGGYEVFIRSFVEDDTPLGKKLREGLRHVERCKEAAKQGTIQDRAALKEFLKEFERDVSEWVEKNPPASGK